MSHQPAHAESDDRERFLRPGALLLWAGAVILVLRGYESLYGIPGMPRFWHQNPVGWFVLGMAGVVLGCRLLLRAEPSDDGPRPWKPVVPGRRFHHVVVYTRVNCPLCDEAGEVLADYANWLPKAMEVDIDRDPQLVRQYDTLVPVVACDGKVRFRGRVDERLLRRLIEGTTPITWP